jgi:hypothetical protein
VSYLEGGILERELGRSPQLNELAIIVYQFTDFIADILPAMIVLGKT